MNMNYIVNQFFFSTHKSQKSLKTDYQTQIISKYMIHVTTRYTGKILIQLKKVIADIYKKKSRIIATRMKCSP